MHDENPFIPPGMTPLRKALHLADVVSSRLLLKLGVESDSLTVLYLHGVFANRSEMASSRGITMSYDGITLDGLKRVIAYFTSHRYTFVSPEELLAGLPGGRRYAMLTFDDGYASNRLVARVLKELKVPAVFFICAANVIENRAFWWDILYRELSRRSWPLERVMAEVQRLKRLRVDEIGDEVRSKFGPEAFTPVGELDRPLTVKELKAFSRQPYVYLGNHTMDHAILTNHREDEVRSQLQMAQEFLDAEVKVNLPIVSYPSGAYSSAVLKVCRELGFKLGFSVVPVKVSPFLSSRCDADLSIGRYSLKSCDAAVFENCDIARSDFLWSRCLKEALARSK